MTREYSVRCEFVRHTFDRLVQWFTTFITLNMAAIGWLVSQEWHSIASIIVIAAFLALQNLLGILAVWRVASYLETSCARLQRLLEPGEELPAPIALYRRTCFLMRGALVSSALVWCASPLLVRVSG